MSSRATYSRTAALVVAACWSIATSAKAQEGRPDVTIDRTTLAETIKNLTASLESTYPDSSVGRAVAREMEKRFRAGRYADTSAIRLAKLLTADLRELSRDPHFNLDYFVVPRPFPAAAGGADARSLADQQLNSKLHNYGFSRVERMAGNVGYLKIDRFEQATIAAPVLEAAMRFLAETDALIIDLRDNGGGYADAVRAMASYFFDEETHLSDFIPRNPQHMRQSWTYGAVPGPKYLDKPVYLLIGPRTFSAAEGLAYDLQAGKRALLVGETTRGGANAAVRTLLSPRFGVIMPSARVIHPVTHANWENGLKPDLPSVASSALDAAYKAALQSVTSKHADDLLTKEINDALRTP